MGKGVDFGLMFHDDKHAVDAWGGPRVLWDLSLDVASQSFASLCGSEWAGSTARCCGHPRSGMLVGPQHRTAVVSCARERTWMSWLCGASPRVRGAFPHRSDQETLLRQLSWDSWATALSRASVGSRHSVSLVSICVTITANACPLWVL